MHAIWRNRTLAGLHDASWMTWLLISAGLYNLIWAAFLAFFPLAPYQLVQLDLLRHPLSFWSMDSVVALFGAAFLIAAREPLRYWPVVLVGFLAKATGSVGFAYLASKNPALWSASWVVILNDVVWLAPFALIIAAAYRERPGVGRLAPVRAFQPDRTRS